MTLSILSSRDADPNFVIALSFTVLFGPPSRLNCIRGNVVTIINSREHPRLTREVIRSRYVSTTHPDMTRVTVRTVPEPRVQLGGTYICYIHVESRTNIASGYYYFIQRGTHGSTSVTVTGELY